MILSSKSQRVLELANDCHNKSDGKFCSKPKPTAVPGASAPNPWQPPPGWKPMTMDEIRESEKLLALKRMKDPWWQLSEADRDFFGQTSNKWQTDVDGMDLYLPRDSYDSLFHYRTDSRAINSALRNENTGDEQTMKNIRDIDTAFESARPLEADTVTYRGVNAVIAGRLQQLESGTVFTDKAFVSTTKDRDLAFSKFGDDVVVIKVPKGVQAINLSDDSYESELLLQRNSRFLVNHRQDADGKPYIELELIV